MNDTRPTAKQLANRIKWAEELRSGKREQAKYRLAKLDSQGKIMGYCCLGVACEVLGMKRNRCRKPFPDIDAGYYGKKPGVHLPPSACRELGIDAEGHLPKAIADGATLWELNDRAGFTFYQIASVIQEQFIDPWVTTS